MGAVLDLRAARVREVPALQRLWADVAVVVRPAVEETADDAALGLAVAALVRSEDGSTIDPELVIATHGARNALCHALPTLDADSPVYYPSADPDTAVAILRSGHRPVPMSSTAGALDGVPRHRNRRVGVVVRPSAWDAPDWDAIVALASGPRFLVVVDITATVADPSPPPLGALLEAGAVITDSASLRLGAPGLRLGWLIAASEAGVVARESVACESSGLASPVLELGSAAVGRYVAEHVRADVCDEIGRRRSQLIAHLPPGLRDSVTGHGLHVTMSLPAWAADPARLTANGLVVGPAQPAGRGSVCLGAQADFATVAGMLSREPRAVRYS